MKILINALNVKTGGGESSFLKLILNLKKIDRKNQYVILLNRIQSEKYRNILEDYQKVIVKREPGSILYRMIFEQLVLPVIVLIHHIDVLYSTGNITSLVAPCRTFLLFENSNPFSFLDLQWSVREKIKLGILKLFTVLSMRRADRIRFLSENSFLIISEHYPFVRKKSTVIPHYYDNAFSVNKNEKIDDDYIICVSDLVPHKNYGTILKTFSLLVHEYHYQGRLKIAGSDVYYRKYSDHIHELARTLKISNHVDFLGKINHMDLYPYYSNARLFVQLSLEETFGLSVLEAMQADIPVIVPKNGDYLGKKHFLPFEEIGSKAVHYTDPYDADSSARLISKVLENKEKCDYSVNLKKFEMPGILEKFVHELDLIRK